MMIKKLLVKSLAIAALGLTGAFLCILGMNRITDRASNFQIDSGIKYLFAGHSHIQLSVNDSLIAHSLNTGESGESYLFTYQKLRKYLQYNPGIKTVFLECTNNSLSMYLDTRTWGEYFVQSKLPKFTLDMDAEDFGVLASHVPLTTMSAFPVGTKSQIQFLFSPEKSFPKYARWGGHYYFAKSNVDSLLMHPAKDSLNELALKMSDHAMRYIDKIDSMCKASQVELVLFRSPLHEKWDFQRNEDIFCRTIQERYSHLRFLDFRRFPLENKDFRDLAHLNCYGSEKFSLFVDSLLRAGLLESTMPQAMIDTSYTGKISGCP